MVILVPAFLAAAAAEIEHRAIVAFYDTQSPQVCFGDGAPSAHLQRLAIVNHYIGNCMDESGDSHVSRRVRYHALLGDFIIANLLNETTALKFYSKTPCSFRARRR